MKKEMKKMNKGQLIYRVALVVPGKETYYWLFNSDTQAMTFADFLMNHYEKSTNEPNDLKYMHVSIMIVRKEDKDYE
jgi:hypothetical protein